MSAKSNALLFLAAIGAAFMVANIIEKNVLFAMCGTVGSVLAFGLFVTSVVRRN